MNETRTIQTFPPEVYRDKDGACPVLTFNNTLVVAAGTSLVSLTTGKRIRVISGVIGSAGAVGTIVFKSSGGTSKLTMSTPANTVAPVVLEENRSGWFESETGEGLTADIGTTAAFVNFRYIVYTP